MPPPPQAPAAPPPADDDWLALDRQLCFALYAGSLAMTKAYRPLLAALGLTYPQYLVMLALWQHGTSAVGTLGEHLSLDSGTLTPLLKRLQSLGLVNRSRDAGDERRVQVALTTAGQALKQQASPIPRQMACSMACDLDELRDLTSRLTALRHRLQAGKPAPHATDAPLAADQANRTAAPVTPAACATPAAPAAPVGSAAPTAPAAQPEISPPAARRTGTRLRSSPSPKRT